MIILEDVIKKYKSLQLDFYKEREKDQGYKTMKKADAIVYDLQKNFNDYDGGTLSELQIELAGIKFFLSDYVANIERTSESLKLELKKIKADRWEEISVKIKVEQGKVKNKQQIENKLLQETYELQQAQVLFETFYYQFKLKLSAINDILTAIIQKISSLREELRQTIN